MTSILRVPDSKSFTCQAHHWEERNADANRAEHVVGFLLQSSQFEVLQRFSHTESNAPRSNNGTIPPHHLEEGLVPLRSEPMSLQTLPNDAVSMRNTWGPAESKSGNELDKGSRPLQLAPSLYDMHGCIGIARAKVENAKAMCWHGLQILCDFANRMLRPKPTTSKSLLALMRLKGCWCKITHSYKTEAGPIPQNQACVGRLDDIHHQVPQSLPLRLLHHRRNGPGMSGVRTDGALLSQHLSLSSLSTPKMHSAPASTKAVRHSDADLSPSWT